MKNKNILLSLIVIIIIGSIFLFITNTKLSEEKGVIKIGAVISLTSFAKIHGENIKEGIDLAVSEINKKGGIKNKEIKVIYEDDATDPKNTVSAVQKLINIDEVEVIIGPTWSFLAGASIPVVNEAKKIMISPSIAGDLFDDPHFFSVFPPIIAKQKAVEDFLSILDDGDKNVIIMRENGPFQILHGDMYKEVVKKTNNILSEEIILQNTDNNDINTEMTKIKNLNPDALLLSLSNVDMSNFLKKAKELDIKTKVFNHEDFIDVVESSNVNRSLAEGFCSIKFDSSSNDFFEKFKKAYNKEPGIYSDTAYDIVYVLAEAIEKYGSGSENIIEGLRKVKYSGISGEINFENTNYLNNRKSHLICLQDGEFSPYLPN